MCLRPATPQAFRPFSHRPDPTFEQCTKTSAIFVKSTNNLSGAHMCPGDPTIMAANPNHAPIPTAPFAPLPPGLRAVPKPDCDRGTLTWRRHAI